MVKKISHQIIKENCQNLVYTTHIHWCFCPIFGITSLKYVKRKKIVSQFLFVFLGCPLGCSWDDLSLNI